MFSDVYKKFLCLSTQDFFSVRKKIVAGKRNLAAIKKLSLLEKKNLVIRSDFCGSSQSLLALCRRRKNGSL